MNNLDINKIIDDAMEKKDRFVSVFIMGATVSVKVEPLESRDPRWILREIATPEKYKIRKYNFECSECHTLSETSNPFSHSSSSFSAISD